MSEIYDTINPPSDPMAAINRQFVAIRPGDTIMTDRGPIEVTESIPLKMPYRLEVHHFAQAMEVKLAKNDHKGGWAESNVKDLFQRLREEVDELERAIEGGNVYEITLEAADIANFAMMICDNTTGGSLK